MKKNFPVVSYIQYYYLSDLSVIGKFGGKCAFAYGAGKDFSLPGGPHQPNEFIDCDKLVEFAKTIAAYIVKVL